MTLYIDGDIGGHLTNAQLLKWLGNQISKLAIERRELLKIQADNSEYVMKLAPPVQGSRLFDIGIIIAHYKELENKLFDEMEGSE